MQRSIRSLRRALQVKQRNLWFTIIISAVVCCGAAQCRSSGDSPLTVTFSATEPAPTLHEPVYIGVTIRNEAIHTVEIDLGADRKANFQFLINCPGAVSARPPGRIPSGYGSLGLISLSPNQAYHQRLLLNEWYLFDSPGDYSVRTGLCPEFCGKVDSAFSPAKP